MDNISADELKEILDREKNNPALDFINVCTPEEHNDNTLKEYAMYLWTHFPSA
jgi:hypothetical protein